MAILKPAGAALPAAGERMFREVGRAAIGTDAWNPALLAQMFPVGVCPMGARSGACVRIALFL